MQLAGVVQDTLLSAVSPEAGGGGVGTNFQVVPFHDSARVDRVSSIAVPALPTAMQLDGLVQDTPVRAAPALASFGVGTTVHLDPFQDSAIGLVAVVVLLVEMKPTAMQAVLLGHEMESNSP